MYNGQIINLLEYQDGQQFIKRAITLLEESQALLLLLSSSDKDNKKYIDKIKEIKKDIDLKNDPSEIDSNVTFVLCEIKKDFIVSF